MQLKAAMILLTASLPVAAAAQPTEPPSLPATRLQTPPVLDGDVLGDPAWQKIVPESNFTSDPNSSVPQQTQR